MQQTQPYRQTTRRCMAALGSLAVLGLALGRARADDQVVLVSSPSATLSGYVSTSAIWMFGHGHQLYGRVFDDSTKQDGFNLDVVRLTLERPLDDRPWAFGYKTSVFLGPDAGTLASSSTINSDFAIRNAYVNARAPIGNGLQFKLGVWDTIIGYETPDAGDNPNYSRSFGFYLEPTVHTGILASYPVNDWLGINAGIADRGEVNTINARSKVEALKSYLGSVTLTAPASLGFLKGGTLTVAVIDSGFSAQDVPGRGGADPLSLYAGASLPLPITGLNVGFAYDYRANGLFDASYENATGAYITWEACKKVKINGRIEYATGSQAAGASGSAGAYGVPPSADVDNVRLLGTTLTTDYALWLNVLTRLEFRWDHSLAGQHLFGDGNQRNAASLVLNLIYRF